MKKLLVLFLAILICLGLVGCAKDGSDENSHGGNSETTAVAAKYMLYGVESSTGNMTYEDLVKNDVI